MEFLTEFSDVWSQPQSRHAIMVHMPIALSLVCLAATFLAAIRMGRSKSLHVTALALTLALTVSALTASRSGENAEGTVKGALSEAGDVALKEHKEMGEQVWLFGLGGCALLAVGLSGRKRKKNADGSAEGQTSRSKPLHAASAWSAFVLAVLTAGWTANTGHFGGKLVYEFGAVKPTGETRPKVALPEAGEGDAIPSDPRIVHFRTHVLPVLQDKCWDCHDLWGMKKAGNLNQTTMAGMLKGGDTGPALVPGHPAKSLIVQAIAWEKDGLQMPPNRKLPEEDIAAFTQWIADGAVWAVTDDDL